MKKYIHLIALLLVAVAFLSLPVAAQHNKNLDDETVEDKTGFDIPEIKTPEIKEGAAEKPEIKDPEAKLKDTQENPPKPAKALSPEVAGHIAKGKRLERRRKYDEAIKEFDAAIALDEEADAAYLGKGLVLIKTGKNLEAVESLKQAVELNPASTDSYMGLGTAYGQLYRHKLAVANFLKVREIEPDNLKALTSALDAAQFGGEFDEAEGLASELVKLNQYSAPNRLALARAHMGLDKFKEAQADIDEAINIKSDLAEAPLVQAELYLASEKYKEAIAKADEAIKTLPTRQEPRIVKARAHFALGELDEALTQFEAIRKEFPKDPIAHYMAAVIYMARNDKENAKKAFKDLADTCGANPQLLKESSRALLKLEDPAAALEIALKALKYWDEESELHSTAAHAYKALGRDEEALIEIEKAKKLGQ